MATGAARAAEAGFGYGRAEVGRGALAGCIGLARGELWTHRARSGDLEVRVRSGSVWLTREGEPADVVLDAGASYRGGSGLWVVEALDPAELSVSSRAVDSMPPPALADSTPSILSRRWLVLLALLAVYLIWGSTYLAMSIALESFTPFVMGGIRFTIAGAVMYAALRLRGTPAPTRKEWSAAARTGLLLLAGGNGLVAVGQQWVSSSVAAVVVATMPLWAALFASAQGQRPSRLEWIGLLIGFGGAALLHAGGDLTAGHAGALVILLAPVCWALGSMWSRRLPLPAGPMATAAQMVSGGIAMATLAVIRGEPLAIAPSGRSVLALIYLAVFGSIVAFTAYGYLLRNTRPAIATSYAYVNPLVAIILGVVVGGELVGAMTWSAAAVIVAGVVILSIAKNRAAPARAASR